MTDLYRIPELEWEDYRMIWRGWSGKRLLYVINKTADGHHWILDVLYRRCAVRVFKLFESAKETAEIDYRANAAHGLVKVSKDELRAILEQENSNA